METRKQLGHFGGKSFYVGVSWDEHYGILFFGSFAIFLQKTDQSVQHCGFVLFCDVFNGKSRLKVEN